VGGGRKWQVERTMGRELKNDRSCNLHNVIIVTVIDQQP